ncbi:hypothetical protein HPB51_004996 [Rhipicephalus microplus]|uniref:Uncharacterized protein n=1 Tax=Rhipicephalus microplus TaxID=6941 RepID=A0A9J6EXS5_RHIMP|nr:hypothetical protein HPB51_004996 [Rhipicephalus microplus]
MVDALAKVQEVVENSMEGENLVITNAGLNDVLKGEDQNLQRQLEDGIRFAENLRCCVHQTSAFRLQASLLVPAMSLASCPVSKPCGLLYTSIVLLILEYGCAVWSPDQQHLIVHIESVKSRASCTLYARSVKSPPADYATHMKIAKWHPLRPRHAVTQMRLLYRLLDDSLTDTPLWSAVRVKKW